MEFDILDSLDDLGYCGPLRSDAQIIEAIKGGSKSLAFTCLVEWLSKELQSLLDLESCIHSLIDIEDSSLFLLEVSSFLKELQCPYHFLLDGPISQRLQDLQSRRTLLDYLCTELQTARILCSKKDVKNVLEIKMDASWTALSLSSALNALDIQGDFNLNPFLCFTLIEKKVRSLLDSNPGHLPPPIFPETLSQEQWQSLRALYEDFLSEYTVRREMLLTRLDVTIQSFKWGEGSWGKEQKIVEAYLPCRKRLQTKPAVQLSDGIAARESLLILQKTSSADLVKNTKSPLNRILIPAVPDRGGRPKEQRPAVEMPNWMKRAPGGGGRGDYHGGGSNWRGQRKKFRGNQGGGGRKRSGGFDAAGSY